MTKGFLAIGACASLFVNGSAAAADMGVMITTVSCSPAIMAFVGDQGLKAHRLYFEQASPPSDDDEIMNCGAAAPCGYYSGTYLLVAPKGPSVETRISKYLVATASASRRSRIGYIRDCIADRVALKSLSGNRRRAIRAAVADLEDIDRDRIRNHRKFGR